MGVQAGWGGEPGSCKRECRQGLSRMRSLPTSVYGQPAAHTALGALDPEFILKSGWKTRATEFGGQWESGCRLLLYFIVFSGYQMPGPIVSPGLGGLWGHSGRTPPRQPYDAQILCTSFPEGANASSRAPPPAAARPLTATCRLSGTSHEDTKTWWVPQWGTASERGLPEPQPGGGGGIWP